MAGQRGRGTGQRSRAIGANYVSPHTRWALLLDDHPDAEVEWTFASADELGIPERFSQGHSEYVVCIIEIPGRRPIEAWKEIPDDLEENNPETFVKYQTMALGRAARKAGYPDKFSDLKSMVLWRQRKAEVAATGGSAVELDSLTVGAPTDAVAALSSGAVDDDPDDDYIDVDSDLDDSISDPDRDAHGTPTDEIIQELQQVLTDLAHAKMQSRLTKWAREQQISIGHPATLGEALALIQMGQNLLREGDPRVSDPD